MSTSDVIRMAARNAFRSRLRTTLTVLSLFVGAFTLTLTTALGAGVSDYVERQVATLSTGDLLLVSPAESAPSDDGPQEWDPDGRRQSEGAAPLTAGTLLNSDDIDAIRGLENVRRVQPINQVSVDWIAVSGTGDGPRYELDVNPTSSIGRSDLVAGDQLDQSGSRDEIVLPEDYVGALGFPTAQDAVGRSVVLGYTDAAREQRQIEATVVGVARESLFASGAGANTALTEAVSDAQTGPGGPEAWPLAVVQVEPGDGKTVNDAEIQRVKDDLAGVDVEVQVAPGRVRAVVRAVPAGAGGRGHVGRVLRHDLAHEHGRDRADALERRTPRDRIADRLRPLQRDDVRLPAPGPDHPRGETLDGEGSAARRESPHTARLDVYGIPSRRRRARVDRRSRIARHRRLPSGSTRGSPNPVFRRSQHGVLPRSSVARSLPSLGEAKSALHGSVERDAAAKALSEPTVDRDLFRRVRR